MPLPLKTKERLEDLAINFVVFTLMYYFVDYRHYDALSQTRIWQSLLHGAVVAAGIVVAKEILYNSNWYKAMKARQKERRDQKRAGRNEER